MKRVTYKCRIVAAVTPERVFHKFVTVQKKDLDTNCPDCGAELVFKFKESYTFFKDGYKYRTNSFELVCPDKRWYNLFSHWIGVQVKLETEKRRCK